MANGHNTPRMSTKLQQAETILARAGTISQFIGSGRDTGAILAWFHDNVLPCLGRVLSDGDIAEAASWSLKVLEENDGETRETFEKAMTTVDESLGAVQDILNTAFRRSMYRLGIDALDALEGGADRSWFKGLPCRGSSPREGVAVALHWLGQARDLVKKHLLLRPERFAPWPMPASQCDPWTALACETLPSDCGQLLKPGDVTWRLVAVRMYAVIELLEQVIGGFSGVSPNQFGLNTVVGPRPEEFPEWPDIQAVRDTWRALLRRLNETAATMKTERLSVLLKLCTVMLARGEHDGNDTSYGGRCGASDLGAVDVYHLSRLWNACGVDELSALLSGGLRDAAKRLAPTRQAGDGSHFEWPEGVERKWSQLRIALNLDTNCAWISAGDSRPRRYSFEEMGFVDRRTKKPNQSWDKLAELASETGISVPESSIECTRLQQQMSQLRKRLRTFFKIKEDPLHDVEEIVGNIASYRPRYTVFVDHAVVIPVAPDTPWEAISIRLDGDDALVIEVPLEARGEDSTQVVDRCSRFTFRDLGLLSRTGRPNKRAKALIGLLRGGGRTEARHTDPDMTKLGYFLSRLVPGAEGRPLRNDGDVWSAEFDVVC